MKPYIIYTIEALIQIIAGLAFIITARPVIGIGFICCGILFIDIALIEYDDYKNNKKGE